MSKYEQLPPRFDILVQIKMATRELLSKLFQTLTINHSKEMKSLEAHETGQRSFVAM